jgi:hypothetical protein
MLISQKKMGYHQITHCLQSGFLKYVIIPEFVFLIGHVSAGMYGPRCSIIH